MANETKPLIEYDWQCKQTIDLLEKAISVKALSVKDLHKIGNICLQACFKLEREQKK